ncbi:MAG: hypothetical protein M1817_003027 [Caeruleum heppii]|nr:MAG: hypothetical protein M1817_003027 [Caeruleum heppii]
MLDSIPFSARTQLNHQLVLCSSTAQLQRADDPTTIVLPDQPRVHLNSAALSHYVEKDLDTPDLNGFAPHLWLLATPSHSNISTLHHQLVKGRRIVLTEDPQLHLLWIYDRIFIKPLPSYLLSHAFWHFFFVSGQSPLPPQERVRLFAAARGFVRTYSFLVQFRSDFDMATRPECRLLPANVDWAAFADFISGFGELDDQLVAPRYHFGELRLTRLRFWSKILRQPFTVEKFYGQYGETFARFYAPLLFLFGALSVALSAMQVELAVPASFSPETSWISFSRACQWFSIATLLSLAITATVLLFLLLKMWIQEAAFALSKWFKNRFRR